MNNKHSTPVSVIIPYYNSSSTIRRALDSVIGQTRLPEEIIIVNDGSGEADLRFLEKTIAELGSDVIPRIHLISLKQNAGPSAARNVGWEASSQPYLAFLDADDSWFRNKIKLQYEWMRNHPEVALTAHLCRSKDTPGSDVTTDANIDAKPIRRKQLLLSGFFSTPSVMLKRNLPFRFDESLKYSEDHYLWLLIVLNNLPAFFFRNYLAFIHKAAFGEGGLSSCLWEMEKGELIQYWKLCRSGYINLFIYASISFYSILKFLRRDIIVRLRNSKLENSKG